MGNQTGITWGKTGIDSKTQPNARFWANKDNGGDAMELNLTQGESHDGYYNLLFMDHPGQKPVSGWVGANDIDALWIPPNWNMKADACGNTNHCESGKVVAEYDGASNNNADVTGLYWPISDAIGINNIDTILLTQKNDIDETDPEGKRTVPYTWDRFRSKCCAGVLPAKSCGIHQTGVAGNDCNDIYKDCTIEDLKVTDGEKPSYRSQYCSALVKSDNTLGDTMKQKYCKENPQDPFCSCMNLTNTPEYILWAKLMKEKHPDIVINPLMYIDAFSGNPCRKHLTTDLKTQYIPSQLTAQIGKLPNTYAISDLRTGDSKDSSKDSSGTPSSGTPSLPTSNNTYMLIIFVIIVIVIAYAYSKRSNKQYPQQQYSQQQYQQPNIQQYSQQQYQQPNIQQYSQQQYQQQQYQQPNIQQYQQPNIQQYQQPNR